MGKITLKEGIVFDGDLIRIQQQTPEFQEWFGANINNLINDRLKPDGFDKYERPVSYSIKLQKYKKTFTIIPVYIYQDKTN